MSYECVQVDSELILCQEPINVPLYGHTYTVQDDATPYCLLCH
jgi:hypothetical protein